MEKQREKKQNNRALDEKKKPSEEKNAPKPDKNWDPNKGPATSKENK